VPIWPNRGRNSPEYPGCTAASVKGPISEVQLQLLDPRLLSPSANGAVPQSSRHQPAEYGRLYPHRPHQQPGCSQSTIREHLVHAPRSQAVSADTSAPKHGSWLGPRNTRNQTAHLFWAVDWASLIVTASLPIMQEESTGVFRHRCCQNTGEMLWLTRHQKVEIRHAINTGRTLLPAGE